MKKLGLKKFLLALVASALLLSGCSNSLDERSDSAEDSAVGSISVNSGDSRAIFADDISYAVATVTGTGINAGSAPSGKSDISGGKGTLSVSGIPAGKNRIVTVQAFNKDGKINGVTMRAICDIKVGENTSVSVNWSSTALGNIFAQLLASGKDLSAVSKDDIEKIKAAIPADVSASLVNASKIASDYVSGGATGLNSSSGYKLSAATVILSTKNISGYKVYVGDPSSEEQEISADTSSGTLIVPPGTWPIYVVDSTGAVKGFGYGTFTDGGEHTISITNDGSVKIAFDRVVIDDRIIVHAKGYSHIWAWETGNSDNNYTGGKWPGEKMTAESSGWYSYVLNYTKADVLFSNNGSNQHKPSGQGGDTLTAGEWWFKDGNWYDGNPEDSVAPIIISFKSDASGTANGIVTLSAEVTDNSALKKVVFYIGEKEIGSSEVSGTSATATCEWNTAYVKNATYNVRAVAYDTANNASEEKTLSITTKNENLPPVAVISGSSYAKLDSTKEFNADSSYDQNGGTIKSYSWSVSGGATISSGSGTSKITVKMPSSAGEVTISLSVTDDEGSSSETVTKTVKVREQTQTSGDFRDETIYFLMTTRFYDGDKSNNRYCWDDESCFNSETLGDPGWRGDFKGLIEKLDYIKALGFTAIWITPVVENASGLDYHGYHAFDFSRVDPRYESTGATYQDLIDAAHAKRIKIIQDIVLNHTGNFGERNLLPIMKKNYSEDDGSHSVSASPDHDSKDIYGNSAYAKLSAGAKLQGYDTYEAIASSNDTSKDGKLYQARLMTMKNDSIDTDDPGRLYHHYGVFQWESYYVQEGQMAGDCVDLNTENPVVAKYLRDCYINYINMGVDAFRIDTMKHISRLTMNKEFIPQFKEAGGEDFFMFGEGCVLRNEVWNAGMPGISVPFYTWNANKNKTDASYSWETLSTGAAKNLVMAKTHFDDNTEDIQITSNNAFLNGNNYHAPDYSKASGLQMIDFFMHHGFENAGAAFGIAKTEDQYFNDATYNVTYVDSHDYGPNSGGYLYTRYSGGTAAWAGNFNLMFTFRGIPCVYYGSEIEFQKSKQIEPYTNGNKVPYAESGRAYYGDHLEGSVSADDVGVYTASGTVSETLNSTLSQHLMRLNQIRRAIPALRKGQYSTEGCNGSVAFKRRYTDNEVDSFAAVAINGGATFTGLPSGTYIEVITGKTVNSNGTITTDSIGEGNMRVYVLKTDSCEVDGKIGKDGVYLK